jgi:hypothetical protein
VQPAVQLASRPCSTTFRLSPAQTLFVLGERAGDECRSNSDNADCKQWMAGTQQNVMIAAGNTVVVEGPGCRTLRDVNVTLQCGPGSTVALRDWGLYGGFIAITGPPTSGTGAVVDNVTVAVDRSRIWAVEGRLPKKQPSPTTP